MTRANKILSDVTIHMKYAKYVPEKERRETWADICFRNMQMHTKKYPNLREQIEQIYAEYVLPKKVLPSMRSLQFGGKPIEGTKVPDIYGIFEPTAIFVPLNEISKKENIELVT